MVKKKKDLSIELLKAFAAILVMNSHMDPMYVEYSRLATGGAIGDALFFFCSGYTIFLGSEANFINWYKRRIRRIYPTVLIIAFIGATYSMDQIGYNIMSNLGSGWFISCIFLYYILLYPIRAYGKNHLRYIFMFFVLMIPVYYFIIGIESPSAGNIYGATYFKWCFFFVYMLLGAICGKSAMERLQGEEDSAKKSFIWNGLGILASIIAFYIIYVFTQTPEKEEIQLFSLLPLAGICYFSWRFCNSKPMINLIESHYLGSLLLFIGGLCLEIYLIQGFIFTTSLNYLFPINIPIIMLAVVISAYIVRCLSRAFLQTFEKEDYRWLEIVKPISR